MLRQVEFKLQFLDEIKINQSMGSVMHGLMMEMIGENGAEWLHSMDSLRPFSQCLYYNKDIRCPIWRINIISEEAETRIMEPILANIGKELYLRNKSYSIKLNDILRDTKSSYQRIADDAFLSEDVASVAKLNFLTTVSFKRDKQYVIMPELYLIYQSLLSKWNAFSSSNRMESEDLDKDFAKMSAIMWYNLQSRIFSLEKTKINGFSGELRLRLSGNEMMRRMAVMLLQYATFAGIGIKNALGMGAVNVELEAKSAPMLTNKGFVE